MKNNEITMEDRELTITLVGDAYTSYQLAIKRSSKQVVSVATVKAHNKILASAKRMLKGTQGYEYLTLLPTKNPVTVLDAFDIFNKYNHLIEKYIKTPGRGYPFPPRFFD